MAELMQKANDQIQKHAAKGIVTTVHFKFTCEHCGERCMLSEPNQLFEYGECHVCGKETKIEVGGYTLMSKMP